MEKERIENKQQHLFVNSIQNIFDVDDSDNELYGRRTGNMLKVNWMKEFKRTEKMRIFYVNKLNECHAA